MIDPVTGDLIPPLTWEGIEELASEDPGDRGIRLAHGFAYDAAPTEVCTACGESYEYISSGKVRECWGRESKQ